jgi:hypothetical protein
MSLHAYSHWLCQHAYDQCRAQRELACMLYRGPSAPSERDEGLLPTHNDPVAYQNLFAGNSEISGGVVAPLGGMLPTEVPAWWTGAPYYGEAVGLDPVALVPEGGALWGRGGSGAPCCDYARLGMSCFCARTEDGLSYGPGPEWAQIMSFDAPVGYGMVDSDWPSIDWRMGVGPGPFLTYPEWFSMEGRKSLQVGG